MMHWQTYEREEFQEYDDAAFLFSVTKDAMLTPFANR